MGLLWVGAEDVHQWGISLRRWPTERSKKVLAVRGLNINHNHDLKNIFKGAATRAAATAGPFQNFYQAALPEA